VFVWLVGMMTVADLLADLLVASLFREKSTAGWWLISQTNGAKSCSMAYVFYIYFFRKILTHFSTSGPIHVEMILWAQ
jgi:hypothetical protein